MYFDFIILLSILLKQEFDTDKQNMSEHKWIDLKHAYPFHYYYYYLKKKRVLQVNNTKQTKKITNEND